jgi:hypothetical protein
VLKREELANPESCLNKARDEEMIFVLLARDAAAPAAIRAWVEKRIFLGKNIRKDDQIQDALRAAAAMENKTVKCQLCPGGYSDGKCRHGAGW